MVKIEIILLLIQLLLTPPADPKPAQLHASHDHAAEDLRKGDLANWRRQQEQAERAARTKEFVFTAFTAGYESTGKRPGDPGYGITTSGAYVQEGVTIACPPSIPLGTVVDVEGYGERICHDRGADIVEGRMDMYFKDLRQAREFGVQRLKVYIKG